MMFAAAADGGVPGPACPSLVPAYVAYGQPTYLVPVGNACPICNPGDRSELWSALAEDGGVQVVGRCFVDGGVTAAVGDICLGGPAAGCGLTCSLFSGSGARGPLSAKARFSRASSSFLSAVDELGGLWMAEAGHGAVFRPETLSAVPETSAGELARPFVSVAPTGIEPEWGGSRMVVAPGIFELSGAGFSWLTNSQMGIDAVVDGRPTWLFTRGSLNGPVVSFVIDTRGHGVPLESRSFGLVALASSGLSAPLRAAACDTGDGGTRLLVGSGDALSAADVSVSADGGLVPASQAELGKLPTLRFALAPVPRADITSLIALPPDSAAHSGAGYALGYLIATGRIFRVRADNPVVWRADEITIEPAEAAAVWKDGARARVGFRDGAVFALPSRVALAPALSTASVVLDFQNVCGHTFAVTGQELYHLVVTSSSAQGSWVRVPLVAADAGLDQPIGRLQSDGQGLLLYRQRGVVERLTGITCLPAE